MFKWLYRLQRKREEGFTLIELMVVVVILGILAAIAVPQLSGKSDEAKDKKARADLKVMESALELYYFDNNEFPATGIAALKTALESNYVKKIKKDPWNEDYVYDKTVFASKGLYGLYTLGKNNGVISYLE